LPGSRRGEITRLLPVFKAAVALLHGRFPGLHCVLPTLPSQAALVRAESRDWPVPLTVVEGDEAKRAAISTAKVALAASGTIAVELAVAGLPAVIAYRTNPLTAQIAKRLIKLRFVSIPNILLDRQVQPELIQWDCTPEAVVAALTPLLEDSAARAAQLAAYRQVVACLTPEDGRSPSERAAEEVLALC
jgi:lipid-A-disaccharide synthase